MPDIFLLYKLFKIREKHGEITPDCLRWTSVSYSSATGITGDLVVKNHSALKVLHVFEGNVLL